MSTKLLFLLGFLALLYVSTSAQDDDSEDFVEQNAEELCSDRPGDEYFRLSTKGDCRDVVRCDKATEIGVIRLATVKCPTGLAFDVERQTCDWKTNVKNCDQLEKPRKVLPLFKTDEPLCSDGKLACGNGECIDRDLFCNDNIDCKDGSDENACSVETDPSRAATCDRAACLLPDCWCSSDGTRIPGDLAPDKVPQMVTISFNGAVNIDNIDLYDEIFNGQRLNPNGCQIRGTFFVSHKYTNYSAVQDLHRRGNEIGVFSVTNKDDVTYWTSGKPDDWLAEMAGARAIIERFANISDGSVVGIRAPYLAVGGNTQFSMMQDQLFTYDATITAHAERTYSAPIWPYSLRFRMSHKCSGNSGNCPSRSFPDLWEVPMNELDRRDDPTFDEQLPGCYMINTCANIQTGEQFGRMLRHNLHRHMSTNRAPLGLHFHATWLKSKKEYKDALIDFIDEMLLKTDVYFVTMKQVLDWIANPVEVTSLRDFAIWKTNCDEKGQPYCSLPNACPLTTRELPGETLRLFTCMQCPNNYPWILDPIGEGLSDHSNYNRK